ncbi:MAG TPA: MgtC/SapB family protein, partial [Mucilaginibacter sp.]|nr:MgtC/SapB family protein [Mucilaginibacter sp.]
MDHEFLHTPAGPIALKMAVAICIGMLIGMERKWSHKEAGIRTFAIIALLGMLSSIIGENMITIAMIGVFLLIIATNTRSLLVDKTLEITTSAALIVNYILGVLVGLGHIFTPVAGAIVMTMLLAWKTELNRFAGGLQPSEIRSAILLGLIGFVIYPIIPDRYVDPWQ